MRRGIPTLIAILLGAIGFTYWAWQMSGSTPAASTAASVTARPIPGGGWGPLRVMTANIRLDEPEDGANGWVHRRDLLVNTLLKYEPEIIACQEVSPAQGAFLRKQLSTWYDYYPRGGIGPGDSAGGTTTSGATRSTQSQILGAFGETLASLDTIFFRSDRFDIVDGEGGLVLPEAPQADAAENMFFSLAVLRERRAAAASAAEPGTLLVVDVHFRHNDAFALRCAYRVEEKVAAWSGKYPHSGIVLLGDINRDRTSRVYAALTSTRAAASTASAAGAPPEAWTGLQDLFDYAQTPGALLGGSYHAFTGRSSNLWPTDLIFLGGGLKVVTAAEIVRDHGPEGRYPSDHFFTMGSAGW